MTMKQRVLKVAKKMYELGLVAGTSGNVSLCEREEGMVAITPTGVEYDALEIDDIVIVSLENGSILQGHLQPTSEILMHLTVYRKMHHVSGIVHTHSPFATSFALRNEPIPNLLDESEIYLKGEVSVAKYAKPGTIDLGHNAVVALGTKTACLLRNHGTLAIGPSVEEALTHSIYLEDSAKIIYYSMR